MSRKKKKETETIDEQQVCTLDKVVAKIYIPVNRVYTTLENFLDDTITREDAEISSTGITVDDYDNIWFNFLVVFGDNIEMRVSLGKNNVGEILKDIYLDEIDVDYDDVKVSFRFGDSLDVLEGVELEFDGDKILG